MSESEKRDPAGDEASDVSRAYRGVASEAPAPAIDDAIRAAARRAVLARPQALRKSWLQRWTGPVAVAAVVVLTVSVGLISVDEKPELAPPPMQEVMKPRRTPPVEAPATLREETSPSPALPVQDRDSSARNRQSVESPRPAPADTITRAPEKTALEKKKTALAPAHEPAPFAADPVSPSGIKTEAPPTADAIDQGMPSRTPAPAAPAKEFMETQRPPLRPAPAAPAVADSPAVASTQRATPQAGEARSVPRANGTAKATDAVEPPEAWLRRIVQLRQGGLTQAAADELARFRRQYPDYPLPAELRGDR